MNILQYMIFNGGDMKLSNLCLNVGVWLVPGGEEGMVGTPAIHIIIECCTCTNI